MKVDLPYNKTFITTSGILVFPVSDKNSNYHLTLQAYNIGIDGRTLKKWACKTVSKFFNLNFFKVLKKLEFSYEN